MTDQHRATDEQWATAEKWAAGDGFGVMHACLLELRDRIQQLEASQQAHDRYAGRPSNMTDAQRKAAAAAPSPSTLVDRVADAIAAAPFLSSPTPVRQARAAIREVAAWLLEQDPEPRKVSRLLGQISGPCGVMADLLMHEADK